MALELEKGVITPQEAVLHMTLRCPLECAHCCVSAGPAHRNALTLTDVLRAIDDFAAMGTIRVVHFVGGDPFMQLPVITTATAHAASLGLACAATTSAFWASSPAHALAVLRPLRDAGFARLTLSYDDPHAQFVDEVRIVNAFHAARALDIECFIAIVRDPAWHIDATYMAHLLGVTLDDADTLIYETAVTTTGRARETATPDDLERRRTNPLVYRGPCRSVLREVSVHPDGGITACCGALPLQDRLRIGRIGDEPIGAAVARAYSDPLLQWLAFEGPMAILRQVTAHTDEPLQESDFDGICQACDVLFNDPRCSSLLDAALPAKRPELEIEEQILAALDAFRRPAPHPHAPHVHA